MKKIPNLNSWDDTICYLNDYKDDKKELLKECIKKKNSNFVEVITIVVSIVLGIVNIIPGIQNNIPITVSWLSVLVVTCLYSIRQNKINKKYDYILMALTKEINQL